MGAGFLSAMLTPLLLLGSTNIVVYALGSSLSIISPQFAMARGLMVIINFSEFKQGIKLGKTLLF